MRRKVVRSSPRLALTRFYVRGYIDRGYRQIWLGNEAAILTRSKQFSLLWLLIFGVLYLVWYMTERDERLRISLTVNGDLTQVRL